MGAPNTEIEMISYKDCGNPLIVHLTEVLLDKTNTCDKVEDIKLKRGSPKDTVGAAWIAETRHVEIPEFVTCSPKGYSAMLVHELDHVGMNENAINYFYGKAANQGLMGGITAFLAKESLQVSNAIFLGPLIMAATSNLYTKYVELRAYLRQSSLTGETTKGIINEIDSQLDTPYFNGKLGGLRKAEYGLVPSILTSNLVTGYPSLWEISLAEKIQALSGKPKGKSFVDRVIEEFEAKHAQR